MPKQLIERCLAEISRLEEIHKAVPGDALEVHDGGRFGEYGEFGPSICATRSEMPDRCQPILEFCGGSADEGKSIGEFILLSIADALLKAPEVR